MCSWACGRWTSVPRSMRAGSPTRCAARPLPLPYPYANPDPHPNPNPNPNPNSNPTQRRDMRTAKGQYGYLRQKAAGGRADAECPVCMSVLGEERRVAVCGHS